MIGIRRSTERGHFDHGWLRTRHTFSFGDYRDHRWMGFGPLRVINQDIVQPGQGFGMHPHRDMEILTYVISGSLQHRDDLGNGSVITPGEIQVMSAGTGVMHSEFNPSADEPVHLLQIWVLPEQKGARPRYDQKRLTGPDRPVGRTLLASPDGRDGSLTWGQDVALWEVRTAGGPAGAWPAESGRRGWLQVVRGALEVEGEDLGPGDAAFGQDPAGWRITCSGTTTYLFFDLP